MSEAELPPAAAALAADAGLGEIRGADLLKGGANNRAYRLDCAKGQAVLKHYFRAGPGQRDRLSAEYAFARFAWNHGVRCLARPLASDPAAGLALYDFLSGRPLSAAEIRPPHVRQAVEFLLVLNRHRREPDAGKIADGAEACFSIDRHLLTVGKRVARLSHIEGSDDTDREARALAGDVLAPLWRQVEGAVRRAAAARGLTCEKPLAAAERCLSPSDFGFHNALVDKNGTVHFIDFEYAGWDDPAKITGDFFNQVAVPVPRTYWNDFAPPLAELSPDPAATLRRMELMLPVYGCKWACIVLNEFLPENAERRRFAGGEALAGRRADQIAKARAKIGEIREMLAYISL